MANASKAWILAVFLVLAVSTPLAAHEGHTHYVMGTIKSLDATHVVVTATDEKAVTVVLTPATRFRRGRAAAVRADLKVGERVVVNVGAGKTPLKAAEVRVGAAK
jgi:hypothetical protein